MTRSAPAGRSPRKRAGGQGRRGRESGSCATARTSRSLPPPGQRVAPAIPSSRGCSSSASWSPPSSARSSSVRKTMSLVPRTSTATTSSDRSRGSFNDTRPSTPAPGPQGGLRCLVDFADRRWSSPENAARADGSYLVAQMIGRRRRTPVAAFDETACTASYPRPRRRPHARSCCRRKDGTRRDSVPTVGRPAVAGSAPSVPTLSSWRFPPTRGASHRHVRGQRVGEGPPWVAPRHHQRTVRGTKAAPTRCSEPV